MYYSILSNNLPSNSVDTDLHTGTAAQVNFFYAKISKH